MDDIVVHSNEFDRHLMDLEKFLQVIKHSGFTLNINKCHFAQSKVKFVGHIIGSRERSPDPDKVSTVKDMKIRETKKEVRRMIELFSYFRDYIPNFAKIAKPLTDLRGKRVSNKIPWGTNENQAFQTLKDKLCEATTQPMSIADFGKSWIIQVDTSSETLLQDDGGQGHRAIAFASQKLTPAQRAWSTIEKEAFAAIWALDKFRNWIFGQHITLYSDHNPDLSHKATSKSPKLMRWALALQQYDVTFRYKEGRKNIVADCLSRLDLEN